MPASSAAVVAAAAARSSTTTVARSFRQQLKACSNFHEIDAVWRSSIQSRASVDLLEPKQKIELLVDHVVRTQSLATCEFAMNRRRPTAKSMVLERVLGSLHRTAGLYSKTLNDVSNGVAPSALLKAYKHTIGYAVSRFDYKVCWYLFEAMCREPQFEPDASVLRLLLCATKSPHGETPSHVEALPNVMLAGKSHVEPNIVNLESLGRTLGIPVPNGVSLNPDMEDDQFLVYLQRVATKLAQVQDRNGATGKGSETTQVGWEGNKHLIACHRAMIQACHVHDVAKFAIFAERGGLDRNLLPQVFSTSLRRLRLDDGPFEDSAALVLHASDENIKLQLADYVHALWKIEPISLDFRGDANKVSLAVELMENFYKVALEDLSKMNARGSHGYSKRHASVVLGHMVRCLYCCSCFKQIDTLDRLFQMLIENQAELLVEEAKTGSMLQDLVYSVSTIGLDSISAFEKLEQLFLSDQSVQPHVIAKMERYCIRGLSRVARKLQHYEESGFKRNISVPLSRAIGDSNTNTLQELVENIELARDDLAQAIQHHSYNLVERGNQTQEEAVPLLVDFFIQVNRVEMAQALIGQQQPTTEEGQVSLTNSYNQVLWAKQHNPPDVVRLIGEMQRVCKPNTTTLDHFVNCVIGRDSRVIVEPDELLHLVGVLIPLCRMYNISPSSHVVENLLKQLTAHELQAQVDTVMDVVREQDIVLSSEMRETLN